MGMANAQKEIRGNHNGRCIGSIKAKQIISTLERMGFKEQKRGGAGVLLRRDGKNFMVPNSIGDISKVVIRKWLRNAGVSEREFLGSF